MRRMLYDYANVTPESVTAATEAGLAEAERLIAAIVESADVPTFAGTLGPLELAVAAVADTYGIGAFMAYVHADPAVRDAAQAAEERITKWRVGLGFREDLYRAVSAFAATDEAERLTGERQRLLEHWMRDFQRAGFALSPADRVELERLRGRLVETEVAFNRNLIESRDWIDVDEAGLAGLPEAFRQRLKPGDLPGTWRITLDTPDYNPFMQQARSRVLREQLLRKKWTEARDVNGPLLDEALELRRRVAALHGQPTWAHYCMSVKMAGTPDRVDAFYEHLVPPLQAAAAREASVLAERMTQDGETPPLQVWDWGFYDDVIARERHSVNLEEISEHLPLDAVVQGMFELTGEVFGLTYREIEPTGAWHPSVKLYEIRDRASGEHLAHFYTDFYPREGKFFHAAAFPLQTAHRRADGGYQRPVSAIVANLTPPGSERPSLLRHGPSGEVETLFHEFGHILHQSLTQAEFPRFAGSETEQDFVEAPSQIMEHWVWEPSVLARFARHWKTGAPVPPELVERLVAARNLNVGLRATRQVFFGKVDLAIHAADAPDLEATTREAFSVTQLPYPDGTSFLASFGHLMGGYDCGYYGYLWAEVIGDDMWSRFAQEGITSPAVGADYRRAILEPGGSKPGDELVRDFLGRDASPDGYLRMRGLTG
ncbi:MAG TPA: M3 family metallopeptidase [Candidatus Limnocylindria bacterium]|nr:M3 family metallopeptidase [Candidatus Limnocylindria bacterium]